LLLRQRHVSNPDADRGLGDAEATGDQLDRQTLIRPKSPRLRLLVRFQKRKLATGSDIVL
jgi:hypothetical protein